MNVGLSISCRLSFVHSRSDKAWKELFKQAALHLVREQVQEGLPAGLYVVKMCVSTTLFIVLSVLTRVKVCFTIT